MDPDAALELIRQGEGQRVEFKTGFGEENGAFESLGAFANADGGTVFLGVRPDASVCGVTIGANTLENFANRLRSGSQPPLSPRIEVIKLEGGQVVAASVTEPSAGQLYHVFKTAFVRVGRTNQVMSPDEQRSRLLQGRENTIEDRDRPRFQVTVDAPGRLERQFSPGFKVSQFSGDPAANLEWRIRGPRFVMDFRPASGAALERTHFVNTFDLSATPGPFPQDGHVGVDQMGFEIRFHWRGRWRSEVHRWPITRRELPNKVLWDIGDENLPPYELD